MEEEMEMAPKKLKFIEENLPLLEIHPILRDWLGQEVLSLAFDRHHRRLRPMARNRTTPALRERVPSMREKTGMRPIFDVAHELLNQICDFQGYTARTLAAKSAIVDELERFYFMAPSPQRRLPFRVPRMTSVGSALDYLENDRRLFADLFCGFSPDMVTELAQELLVFLPELNLGYSAEERLLCVFARYKQTVSSWSLMGFLFQRSAGALCTMFSSTVELILDAFDWLISLDAFDLVPPDFLNQSHAAFVQKWRTLKRNPTAELPERFSNINCLLDGSHFEMCRPGGNSGDDVQRNTSDQEAHTINVVFIVLANGLRLYTGFTTDRQADPFLYTTELDEACAQTGLVMLCDAIFAANAQCKPLSNEDVTAMDKIMTSALRIPVEFLTQDMPLLATPCKLKVLQTRPKSLVQLGTLLANFKLCLRGENITTYLGLDPPQLHDYLEGKLYSG